MTDRYISRKRRKLRVAIYDRLQLVNCGKVPCHVCGEHVRFSDATLEHIVPLSKGGTDERHNLAISHGACNRQKADEFIPRNGPPLRKLWAKKWQVTPVDAIETK